MLPRRRVQCQSNNAACSVPSWQLKTEAAIPSLHRLVRPWRPRRGISSIPIERLQPGDLRHVARYHAKGVGSRRAPAVGCSAGFGLSIYDARFSALKAVRFACNLWRSRRLPTRVTLNCVRLGDLRTVFRRERFRQFALQGLLVWAQLGRR